MSSHNASECLPPCPDWAEAIISQCVSALHARGYELNEIYWEDDPPPDSVRFINYIYATPILEEIHDAL